MPCGGRSIILTIKRFGGGMPSTSSWSRYATNPFAAENPQFKYDLREKLVGLGNQRGYRVLFTIREQTVYVLAIHRAAQDTIHPDDLPAVPGEQ